MKKSSYCYTTSSNHLCKQSSHSSTAFQTSMSPFIYHILLSLTDLSLIYSCRLHGQSICHATQSISLHTGCIPCDQEICLPTTQLINLHTSCRLHGQSICHATRLINLHTSCVLCDEGICVSTDHSIDQSTYQLHAPRWENLPISYTINQSTY